MQWVFTPANISFVPEAAYFRMIGNDCLAGVSSKQ